MKYFYFIFLFGLLSSRSEKQITKKSSVTNPLLDKAYSYLDRKKFDTAFVYFNKAKNIYVNQQDSVGIGTCLINMGIISTDNGDHFGAQEILLEALGYFSVNDTTHINYIKSIYNTLGMASSNLKNYSKAIDFYNQSLKYDLDSSYFFIIENNIGNAYRDKGDYKKALAIYTKILEKSSKYDSNYAKTLTNNAVAKWLQNPNHNPVPQLLKALYIRQNSQDLQGQNSSYSHLSDYYSKKNSDSALYYANKMYEVNREINSPDDRLEALKKLIRLSPSPTNKHYFKIYEQLNDSLQTTRSAAKNQFALIRYETEKHKADFLKAQTANVEKQKNILIKNIGIGFLIVSLISGYFWYRRRQKLLNQEKEIEVKNTEIRYAKKVHDHVANRIYQVMDEIDNNPKLSKDEVAEKLDVIYHISRDLSYENIGAKYKHDFTKELSKMFSSYQSPKITINVKGNNKKLWNTVQQVAKSEVYAILQELMTNMSKHSMANVVQVEFLTHNKQVTILYSDNGKGIKNFSAGNGLSNTETRIKSISGLITFDTKPDQGLKVKISFPI